MSQPPLLLSLDQKNKLFSQNGGTTQQQQLKNDLSQKLIRELYNNGTKPNLSQNYQSVFRDEMMNATSDNPLFLNSKLSHSISENNNKSKLLKLEPLQIRGSDAPNRDIKETSKTVNNRQQRTNHFFQKEMPKQFPNSVGGAAAAADSKQSLLKEKNQLTTQASGTDSQSQDSVNQSKSNQSFSNRSIQISGGGGTPQKYQSSFDEKSVKSLQAGEKAQNNQQNNSYYAAQTHTSNFRKASNQSFQTERFITYNDENESRKSSQASNIIQEIFSNNTNNNYDINYGENLQLKSPYLTQDAVFIQNINDNLPNYQNTEGETDNLENQSQEEALNQGGDNQQQMQKDMEQPTSPQPKNKQYMNFSGQQDHYRLHFNLESGVENLTEKNETPFNQDQIQLQDFVSNTGNLIKRSNSQTSENLNNLSHANGAQRNNLKHIQKYQTLIINNANLQQPNSPETNPSPLFQNQNPQNDLSQQIDFNKQFSKHHLNSQQTTTENDSNFSSLQKINNDQIANEVIKVTATFDSNIEDTHNHVKKSQSLESEIDATPNFQLLSASQTNLINQPGVVEQYIQEPTFQENEINADQKLDTAEFIQAPLGNIQHLATKEQPNQEIDLNNDQFPENDFNVNENSQNTQRVEEEANNQGENQDQDPTDGDENNNYNARKELKQALEIKFAQDEVQEEQHENTIIKSSFNNIKNSDSTPKNQTEPTVSQVQLILKEDFQPQLNLKDQIFLSHDQKLVSTPQANPNTNFSNIKLLSQFKKQTILGSPNDHVNHNQYHHTNSHHFHHHTKLQEMRLTKNESKKQLIMEQINEFFDFQNLDQDYIYSKKVNELEQAVTSQRQKEINFQHEKKCKENLMTETFFRKNQQNLFIKINQFFQNKYSIQHLISKQNAANHEKQQEEQEIERLKKLDTSSLKEPKIIKISDDQKEQLSLEEEEQKGLELNVNSNNNTLWLKTGMLTSSSNINNNNQFLKNNNNPDLNLLSPNDESMSKMIRDMAINGQQKNSLQSSSTNKLVINIIKTEEQQTNIATSHFDRQISETRTTTENNTAINKGKLHQKGSHLNIESYEFYVENQIFFQNNFALERNLETTLTNNGKKKLSNFSGQGSNYSNDNAVTQQDSFNINEQQNNQMEELSEEETSSQDQHFREDDLINLDSIRLESNQNEIQLSELREGNNWKFVRQYLTEFLIRVVDKRFAENISRISKAYQNEKLRELEQDRFQGYFRPEMLMQDGPQMADNTMFTKTFGVLDRKIDQFDYPQSLPMNENTNFFKNLEEISEDNSIDVDKNLTENGFKLPKYSFNSYYDPISIEEFQHIDHQLMRECVNQLLFQEKDTQLQNSKMEDESPKSQELFFSILDQNSEVTTFIDDEDEMEDPKNSFRLAQGNLHEIYESYDQINMFDCIAELIVPVVSTLDENMKLLLQSISSQVQDPIINQITQEYEKTNRFKQIDFLIEKIDGQSISRKNVQFFENYEEFLIGDFQHKIEFQMESEMIDSIQNNQLGLQFPDLPQPRRHFQREKTIKRQDKKQSSLVPQRSSECENTNQMRQLTSQSVYSQLGNNNNSLQQQPVQQKAKISRGPSTNLDEYVRQDTQKSPVSAVESVQSMKIPLHDIKPVQLQNEIVERSKERFSSHVEKVLSPSNREQSKHNHNKPDNRKHSKEKEIEKHKQFVPDDECSMERHSLQMRNLIINLNKRKQMSPRSQVFHAIQNGYLNEIEEILTHNQTLSLDTQDDFGNTFLIVAAQSGNMQMTNILLAQGGNINQTNRNGDTALHISLAFGFTQIADILIIAGSNQKIKNKQGQTPWDMNKLN